MRKLLIAALIIGCQREEPPPPLPTFSAARAAEPVVAIEDAPPRDPSITVHYAIDQLSLLLRGGEGSRRGSEFGDPKLAQCMQRFMAVKPIREEILAKLDAIPDQQAPGVYEMQDATMKAVDCLNCSSAADAAVACAAARKSIAAAKAKLKGR